MKKVLILFFLTSCGFKYDYITIQGAKVQLGFINRPYKKQIEEWIDITKQFWLENYNSDWNECIDRTNRYLKISFFDENHVVDESTGEIFAGLYYPDTNFIKIRYFEDDYKIGNLLSHELSHGYLYVCERKMDQDRHHQLFYDLKTGW